MSEPLLSNKIPLGLSAKLPLLYKGKHRIFRALHKYGFAAKVRQQVWVKNMGFAGCLRICYNFNCEFNCEN
jgi:hypothetical protein